MPDNGIIKQSEGVPMLPKKTRGGFLYAEVDAYSIVYRGRVPAARGSSWAESTFPDNVSTFQSREFVRGMMHQDCGQGPFNYSDPWQLPQQKYQQHQEPYQRLPQQEKTQVSVPTTAALHKDRVS